MLPDDAALAPQDAVPAAQRLIDSGHPFHAHELLEACWKAAPDDGRELWRGLAQLAVGLTHARRGNDRGAVALLRRGALTARAAPGAAPAVLDLHRACQEAVDLADRISRDGLAALPADELRITLLRG